eukprot:280632-Amphidinium_carterae.1
MIGFGVLCPAIQDFATETVPSQPNDFATETVPSQPKEADDSFESLAAAHEDSYYRSLLMTMQAD